MIMIPTLLLLNLSLLFHLSLLHTYKFGISEHLEPTKGKSITELADKKTQTEPLAATTF